MDVAVPSITRAAGPTAIGRKVRTPRSADLEVEAGVRLDEPLVRWRAVEAHFAVRPYLEAATSDVQLHHQLVIEIIDDRPREHTVEREAADQQERRDPRRGNDDHAP